jgi:CheY-like chemotaxis protein
VDAALRGSYDLIVMDVQMPGMDGLEATRKTRSCLSKERQPYILALTAHATTDDRQSCLAAGMDDYFTKPIDLEALQSKLNLLNNSSRSCDSLRAAGQSGVSNSCALS